MPCDLVVRVMRPEADIPGSIPGAIKFYHLPWSGQPERKSVFSCPNKACTQLQPMNNVGGLPRSATHPPTQKTGHPPWGGGTCIFPKIRENPDKPTHPPSDPPPPPRYSINQSLSYGLVHTACCVSLTGAWARGAQGHRGTLQLHGGMKALGGASCALQGKGSLALGELAPHEVSSILGDGSRSNGHEGEAQDSKQRKLVRSLLPVHKCGTRRVSFPPF